MSEKLRGIVLDQSTLGTIEFPSELKDCCDWTYREMTNSLEVKEIIKEYDVVLTNKVALGQQELEYSEVKYIGVLATGTNIIDLNYCADQGIEVKNAVGYSTDSVAQHTFTLLFSFLGGSSYNDTYTKGEYARSSIFTHFGYEYQEIKDKTWGIIGLGNIGRKVADIANVFGAKVIYYSTSGKNRSDKYQRVELDELLSLSDIISIHAPLNNQTNQLIDHSSFKKMKQNAILLNLGRGGIVVEKDLIQALNNHELSGACLDVFEQEPFDFQEKYVELLDKSKLLLSPHVAWASVEARQKLLEITADNLSSWKNKRKASFGSL